MRYLLKVLTILCLISPSLLGLTTLQQDTATQFQAGTLNQTQIRIGSAARLELLFGFSQLPDPNPPDAADQVGMCYDQQKNIVILFGGENNSSIFLNKTWKLDPTATSGEPWAPIYSSTVPYSRAGAGMASLGNGQILMFGGVGNSSYFFNDTWIFDIASNNWLLQNPTVSPPARQDFAMASDTTTGEVLLFGGTAGGSYFSDTWVYDTTNNSWTQRAPLSSPTARSGAAITFNSADGNFYLFGGYDGTQEKQDVWKYNINLDTWGFVEQGLPQSRENACMCFDSRYSKIVLWGGALNHSNSSYENSSQIWYFDSSVSSWYTGVPASTPMARQSFGMSYVQSLDKIFIFGGRCSDGNRHNDSQYYAYRSTGDFTSAGLDGLNKTAPFKWLQLAVPSYTEDANTSMQFQVASSPDNNINTYSQFTGPDGTPATFYTINTSADYIPFDITPSSCTARWLKYKVYLASTDNTPPHIPSIGDIALAYNYTPSAPVLNSPLNGCDTNYVYPQFTWNSAVDYDSPGDTLTYQIQIFQASNLTVPIISTDSIAALSFSTGAALGFGTYLWQVRAFDGTMPYGVWSSTYTLYVDTIAPNAISTLTALEGAINNQIELNWINPSDQTPAPAYIAPNYYYHVAYSSSGPVTSTGTLSACQYQDGQVSSSSGTLQTANVNGLATGTTYYFAVFIQDVAGNYSGISTPSSVYACTNSSPTVSLNPLSPSTSWATGIQTISWTAGDPDIGDMLTYSIYISSDAGVDFNITIASGLVNGTTFFSWNTETVVNGSQYKIMVKAQDIRGLYFLFVMPSTFTVYNQNYAPSVAIVSPQNNVVSSGTLTISWVVTDVNLTDTHTYNVYISSDSGSHYINLVTSSTQTSYSLNTKLYSNGANYAIQVTATDQGGLSGGATVAFMIGNNNLSPNAFSLLAPANGSATSPLSLVFSWQNNGAPNPSDTLTYTIYFSTNLSFNPEITVTPIMTNSYQINTNILPLEAVYYWKVTAQGPLGLVTYSNNDIAWSVLLTRSQANSADGRVHVQILDGLPANGYIKVDKYNTDGDNNIAAANKDVLADRNIKVIGDDVYQIYICDVNGNNIAAPSKNKAVETTSAGAVNITASIVYIDPNNTGYFNGTLVPVSNLRGAMLNTAAAKWELAPKPPVISTANKNITMSIYQNRASDPCGGAYTSYKNIFTDQLSKPFQGRQ